MLTPRDARDIDELVAMDSDIEVRRYITPAYRDHFDPETVRAHLLERLSTHLQPGLGWWTLRERKSRAFIGMALLIPVGLAGPQIEIGWRLPRAMWGCGYAHEAAQRILEHAFVDVALSDVIACIDPMNARSIALAHRFGFMPDGRQAAYGHEYDKYRLTCAGWQPARAAAAPPPVPDCRD
jgi:RimJ/RimL family protein N-acetyltransferase